MLIRTALAIAIASLSLSGVLFAGDIDGLKGQGFDLDGQSFFIVGITKTGDGVGIRAFTVIPASAKGAVESRRWNSTGEALEFLRSQRREVAANRFNSIDANGVQLVYDPGRQALVSPQTAAASQRRAQQTAAEEIERTLQVLRDKQAEADYRSRFQRAQRTSSQSNSPSGSRVPGYSPSATGQPLGWPYRDADGMVRIPTAQDLDPQTFPPNRAPLAIPSLNPTNTKPFYIGDPSSPMEQMHRIAEEIDRRNTEFLRTASPAAKADFYRRQAEHNAFINPLLNDLARGAK
jgi:hypothetical protein